MPNKLPSLSHCTALSTRLWVAVAALGLSAAPALANPVGGNVSSGQATIAQSGNTEVITQTSNKAVINWQSFNIANGETTQFVQPGSSAIALNRIGGSSASQIFGTLTANGRVWLVNANGIFFGPSAQVNVAGLIASTANISDTNFMNGNYVFDQPGNPFAGIVNQGNITIADTGLAGLFAPGVRNDGVISAHLGKVVLASGETFTAVDTYGDGLFSVAITSPTTFTTLDQNGNPMTSAASNTGSIIADGGTVYIGARTWEGIFDNAINISGLVQAQSIGVQNGEIVLDAGVNNNVVVTGTLDASGKATGSTGGKVYVESDGGNVTLAAGSVIDVSGDVGGGEVEIGGDFHNLSTTPLAGTVSANGTINAQAITSGNGGEVYMLSDADTNDNSAVYANGGANGGNGGTFGLDSYAQGSTVEFSHDADVSAGGLSHVNDKALAITDPGNSNTDPGTVIIDPENLTISNSTHSGINAAALQQTLNNGANMTVRATDSLNVTNANLTWGPQGSLSLIGTNNINVSGSTLNSAKTNGLTLTTQNVALQNSSLTSGGRLLMSNQPVIVGTAAESGANTAALSHSNAPSDATADMHNLPVNSAAISANYLVDKPAPEPTATEAADNDSATAQ